MLEWELFEQHIYGAMDDRFVEVVSLERAMRVIMHTTMIKDKSSQCASTNPSIALTVHPKRKQLNQAN